MKRSNQLFAITLATIAACSPATAKVFFRIAPSPLPPADRTGMQDLVLAWPLPDSPVVVRLRSQGYRVWLQCESKDLAETISAADRTSAEGVIVTIAKNSNQPPDIERILRQTSAHKNMRFRVLIPGGKQPQIKGRLVVERDGVLQVSSPSTQPWLDTNLAMVRLSQSIHQGSIPVIYDFHWNTPETARDGHPSAEDYALAIAEADLIHSDVVLDLPNSLQEALTAGDSQDWLTWKSVKPYLTFSFQAAVEGKPIASLGVIFDDIQTSYEPINLLARHNLAFDAIRPSDLTPSRLAAWNSVIVFCALKAEAATMLREFASKGGIVIFVNSHDEFSWHSTPPSHKEAHSATYKVGAGQIVELGEPVIDPESFARDVRRLIGRERSSLALWNSLTTLVTAYRETKRSEITLLLVNYADQPDNVQVQVKGRYTRVRWESPEEPCCSSLPFVERNGFTEFTAPSLRITARVHLDSAGESSAPH
jgi:hypothetical protein